MFEHSLTSRERLPNYEDSDYILKDGKKVLNPDWQKAREDRLNTKNDYFRCPVCNQGIAFIIDDPKPTDDPDSIIDPKAIYFIHPEKDRINGKVTGIISYEYFIGFLLPSLYQHTDIRTLSDTYEGTLFDPYAYLYACYQCYQNGIHTVYIPIQLIYKYQNPLSVTCDYEDICDICGDQIYQTVIPVKIDGKITMRTVSMCSNEKCNYTYKRVNKKLIPGSSMSTSYNHPASGEA